jgi:elongation of very long chain fatty acids protein 4
MTLDTTQIVVVPTLYLICIWVLTRWMKSRKPFNCKMIMIPYNIVQVCLSLYVTIGLFPVIFRGKEWWNWMGLNIHHPDLHHYYYIHYYFKYFDFLDTLFIILSKKSKQLSFLHVSHHTTVVLLNGLPIIIDAIDVYLIEAMINAFVHTVMYFYYFLAAVGHKSSLKPYITKIQMLQFFIAICMSIVVYWKSVHPYTLSMSILSLMYSIYLIIFFTNFSNKTYGKRVNLRS